MVMIDCAPAGSPIRQAPILDTYIKAFERKQQTHRRLLWLQSLLDDVERFDAIVASGRYLKLCALIKWANEMDEIAERRLGDADG
jgi:hypothetical protein